MTVDERSSLRRGRARRAAIALVGMTVVIALVAVGIVSARRLERDSADDAYRAAALEATLADRAVAEAEAEIAVAAAELDEALGVARGLAEPSDALVDAPAREDFVATLDAVSGEHADRLAVAVATSAAVEPADPGGRAADPGRAPPGESLSAAEIRSLATELRAGADARRDAARDLAARARLLRDGAAELAGTIAGYLEATAAHGRGLREDRDDAADEALAALDSELAALVAADVAEAPAAFAAYRDAAAAVVASSDAARARPAPGSAGGYVAPPALVVDDPASVTVIVNKRRALPAGYVPSGLVIPAGIPNNNNQPVRSDAAAALQSMAAAASAEGITLRIASAYRSFATQKAIYTRYVRTYGLEQAERRSARPGHSEHQTGLGVDLDDGTGCVLQHCFGDRPGGRWLRANAHRFGFVLRYDQGTEATVGYYYEPWHYRFVGVDVATAVKSSGARTLEDYYGLPAAPDYG